MNAIKDLHGAEITADSVCVYVGEDDFIIPRGAKCYVASVNPETGEATIYSERQEPGKYTLMGWGSHSPGTDLVLLESAPVPA